MSVVADFPVPGGAVSRSATEHRGKRDVVRVHPATRRRTTLPSPAAQALLRQAKQGLLSAEWEAEASERFTTAYLAALRGAAAMLALRGRPHRHRAKPTSAWVLLTSMAPELTEWAEFFSSLSATNAAVQSGITRGVTHRLADDLIRQADQFLELISRVVPGV